MRGMVIAPQLETFAKPESKHPGVYKPGPYRVLADYRAIDTRLAPGIGNSLANDPAAVVQADGGVCYRIATEGHLHEYR